jgi:photosystem II stability/assembly factor-like uncharacterized protein
MRERVAVLALMAILPASRSPAQNAPSTLTPHWTAYRTGVGARLRGVSAVSDDVVWASGANGTIIRTEDGGRSWTRLVVPDAEKLDFRDIDAVNERTAYALSIGNGDASRIYKTSDAGAAWTLQFKNDDPKAFFDAMVFRDARAGFAVSDSVGGQLVILRTTDGGAHWSRVAAGLPPALDGEGAYAASGTNIAVHGSNIWIGTSASRVIRSTDDGRTWSVASTPLAASASAGIFSIAFLDPRRGIAVGGDYRNEKHAVDNAAVSDDGGRSWAVVKGLGGFRSVVAFIPKLRAIVAVGPSGADYSVDGGRTWHPIDGPGFHTASVAPRSRSVWAAGEQGAVARLDF